VSSIFHVDFDDGAEKPWRNALCEFGYSPSFEAAFRDLAEDGEVPARIVEEQRDRFRIVLPGEDGELREEEAQVSGSLARESASAAGLPAVGDWAAIRPRRGGCGLIRKLLPRASAFMRKAPGDVRHDRIDAQVVAANVDAAFIVAAAGRDWNLRRIERYVALSRAAGALPVLVIAKADLAEDPEALLVGAARAAPGLRTALICAPEGRGLSELSFALQPGKTIVLVGSSGAGKSTLLNALAGGEVARTGEVRADDQRGRHTTAHRQLFRLPSGALAIDTPGMRELQLWADEEAVGSAFPEIEALASECRFRDCAHENEPGCGVRAALEAGELDAGRYESWRKLSKEAAFLKTREDGSAREAERRRWRSIEMSRRSFAKEASAREKRSR
jgi:ribosome biogenesis GTPase / thiamine phosphate phosphatase